MSSTVVGSRGRVMRIRAPIVVVLGHVDVGKTLLLDKIRGTAVAYREPGMITQHVGASFLPWKALENYCGELLDMFKLRGKVKIPGFLMIDTPGHAAFSNLRKRGGSVADLAILVIDVLEGFEEQTYECIEILKARKVPFVVAANKIDRIPGWKPQPNKPFLYSIQKQREDVVERLEELLARIILEFNKLGFNADRYDRVRDFAHTVAIVPTSALTGEGVADLLLVLAGIAQRFSLDKLKVSTGAGRGVVLEVKEEKGLGVTADVILYDGIIRKGDTIVVGGLEKPIVTRVRALLVPKPMDEMRDPEDRFYDMDRVEAAAGVKLVAPDLDKAVAGAPVFVVPEGEDVEKYIELVRAELAEVRIQRDVEGVVAKADTLGTLESMVLYLRAHNIPVRIADIGPVSKRDIFEAYIAKQKNPMYGVVLAFNVKVPPDVEDEAIRKGVKIFQSNILYRLVEEFLKWFEEVKQRKLEEELSKLIRPAKIRILPGYIFRRSDPAIVGVEVLSGVIKPGYPLMRADGRSLGHIMQIQEHGKPLPEARKGAAVAISIRGNVIVGRHIKEGDIVYVDVPLEHCYRWASDYRQYLSDDEVETLREILNIKKELKEKRRVG